MNLIKRLNSIQKRALYFVISLVLCVVAVNAIFPVYKTSSARCWLAFLFFLLGASVAFAWGSFKHLTTEKTKFYYLISTIAISSVLTAIGVNYVYCIADGSLPFAADSFIRIILISMILSVAIAYVVFDANATSDFMHKNRWLIAAIVFTVFVALNLNFSNVACFHYSVQPDSQTAFTLPIFGVPRGIRSDEWLVDLPRRASAEYSGYGLINDIVRATTNYNISSSYLYISYSALTNPLNFGYFLFGTEYGTAFHWSGLFILSIIVSYEFSLIITKGNRRCSLLGASILGLSSFALWWSVNIHIMCLQAIIVSAYHFFRREKLYEKVLLALGVSISAACFVCSIYPAWQVPAAYLLMAMFAWVIIESFDKIKAMKWHEWTVVGAAFVFMVSIISAYLFDTRAYNEAIMDTIYPGKRFDTGGNSVYKGSWYIQTLLYPFKDTGNNSEAGTFFSLFPLPMVIALVFIASQIIRKVKNKEVRIDVFSVLLLIPTFFITVYCTKGFPEWLAKISLMSYSIKERAVDLLCIANAFLLIRILSYKKEEKITFPTVLGFGVGVLLVLYNVKTTEKYYPGYMTSSYIIIAALLVIGLVVALLCSEKQKYRNLMISVATVAIAVSGLSVLPITRGLDSLLGKPASLEVQRIVEEDPDAKWIGYDTIIFPQFLIANGAPTINSVNYIPNMELWHKLDPEGKYNEVYNRYAHVACVFVEGEETNFVLTQPDLMVLRLSYDDVEKTGAKYVFSPYGIAESSDKVDLNLIYNEGNIFIYEIIYN